MASDAALSYSQSGSAEAGAAGVSQSDPSVARTGQSLSEGITSDTSQGTLAGGNAPGQPTGAGPSQVSPPGASAGAATPNGPTTVELQPHQPMQFHLQPGAPWFSGGAQPTPEQFLVPAGGCMQPQPGLSMIQPGGCGFPQIPQQLMVSVRPPPAGLLPGGVQPFQPGMCTRE